MMWPWRSRTGEMVTEIVDARAVLAQALDIEMVDALAAAQAAEDVALLVAQLRRHDQVDRLADRLFRGPSEQPLRALVPGGDDAVERLADDGVFGRRDDGGEQRLRLDLVSSAEVGR